MKNRPRPYVLAETNWKDIKEHHFDVVVLPWGATEAHNYHMPYATDNYQVEYVAAKSAEKAWDMGKKVLVLPNIPFGVNTGQLDIEFCINMNPSTQLSILKDVCDTIRRHGATKLVILNGHGANNFVSMIRELAGVYPDLFVCVVNWFQSSPVKEFFEQPGDHADEMETSVMLHLYPELLLPLDEAGDGKTLKFAATGFKQGWAWTQRPWSLISKDTGSGDPSKANAQKGSEFLDNVTTRIAEFFSEICGKSIQSLLQ